MKCKTVLLAKNDEERTAKHVMHHVNKKIQNELPNQIVNNCKLETEIKQTNCKY